TQAFDLAVPEAPQPVRIGDTTRLVYELHATNFSADELVLRSVSVADAASGNVLAEFRDDALSPRIEAFGVAGKVADRRIVRPGMRAVVYLEIDAAGATPRAIGHTLEYEIGGAKTSSPHTLESARTPIRGAAAPVLGPPLRGGPWAAVYDPSARR